MEKNNSNLLDEVAHYYSSKLAQFGPSPQGVDWNNAESQILRFKQLAKIIDVSGAFSINDLGAGYGAFYDFLASQYDSFSYSGIDVSADMIQAAKLRYSKKENAQFIVANRPLQAADYGISSGIFNVRQKRSDQEWKMHMETVIDILNQTSRIGFAFNCLTSYSDEDKKRPDLYYADPGFFFDFCKKRYSRNVALLHDYGLYEFTILVRKCP